MARGTEPTGAWHSGESTGNDWLVRMEDEAVSKFADVFAASNLRIDASPASTRNVRSLNAGRRNVAGQPGEITATMEVFRNPASPGQYRLRRANQTEAKIVLRRIEYGEEIDYGTDIALSGNVVFKITARSTANNVPTGGVLTIEDSSNAVIATEMAKLNSVIQRGYTIQTSDTARYFVERVNHDASGNVNQIIIGEPHGSQDSAGNGSYDWQGAAVSTSTGTVTIYDNLTLVEDWTGLVTAAPFPSDDSTGEDSLTRATISFTFDDLGTAVYTTPT